MTDETSAPAGGEAIAAAPAPEAPTPSDIGRMLAGLRQQKEPERAEEPATGSQQELAPEADAAPAEQVPGETQTQDADPADVPLIEPPRSWTKAEKERFQSLPRETQEYLHTREQEREREVRRSQNEAAEIRKAAEADRVKAEQVRQQYEAKLPALMQAIHDTSPFADIKSMADVEKLQAEDPFRFQQFQVYQWKMQGVQADLQAAEQRKAGEEETRWTDHVRVEDGKFAESLSEADKAKITNLMADAPQFLEDRGFSRQELSDMWNGKERLSLRDHRVQALILDGMKYRNVQKAKLTPTPPPAPHVQRPGVPEPKGDGTLQALSKQHDRSGSIRDLGALIGGLRRAK